MGIQILDPWVLLFDNTAILLMSGITVTWGHRAIYSGNLKKTKGSLLYIVLLGIWFIIQQYIEYTGASFFINGSIYGSVLYMATGFHGFHLIIGTLFLFFCFLRFLKNHFTVEQYFGFEAVAWYWHFVGVVWLFLYVTIYWWSSIYI
jgi:heme/copper-type cytochrome/quinol oxidase subunit 3